MENGPSFLDLFIPTAVIIVVFALIFSAAREYRGVYWWSVRSFILSAIILIFIALPLALMVGVTLDYFNVPAP